MYLCDDCENKPNIFSLDGDSRCSKHGLTGFHIEPLEGLSCAVCAEKVQRCQVCGCYVNAKEHNEKWMEKHRIKNTPQLTNHLPSWCVLCGKAHCKHICPYWASDTKETIISCAIKTGENTFSIVSKPGRHNDIIKNLVKNGFEIPIIQGQGFLTSTGRFVGRKEAKEIASKADQITKTKSDNLFSEDLW